MKYAGSVGFSICTQHTNFRDSEAKKLRESTLMLHTYVEEKRARVRKMWLRTGLDRPRRTLLYVKSCPRRAQPQMAFYRVSAAVFAGVGMQH